MHSAIIHLSENANVILEETSTYPWTAFLSDTGGALGKFEASLFTLSYNLWTINYGLSYRKYVSEPFISGLFLGLSILNILRFSTKVILHSAKAELNFI